MLRNANKKGFTLIETFVAITILLVAIIGPLSMLAGYFTDIDYVKRQTTATFLAQEGLELLMTKREYNLRNGENAFKDMDECFGNDCLVRPISPDKGWPSTCLAGGCPFLKFDTDHQCDKYFLYDTAGCAFGNPAPDSAFRRTVRLERLADSEDGLPVFVKATVTVNWEAKGGGPLKKTEVSSYLYDKVY